MARVRSLANLIADCRQRASMENSTFVTDAEITEYLNQELAELWTRLVQNEGAPHFRSLVAIDVVAGTAVYGLPADFWRLQCVEAQYNGSILRLRPFMSAEHAPLNNEVLTAYYPLARYRVQASNIEFAPATQTFTANVYYTPSQVRLVSPSDTFDGYNGYEVAAIYGAVATMLAKEESDPSFWMGLKDRILAQIDALAGMRDVSEPERVQDVTTDDMRGFWPFRVV